MARQFAAAKTVLQDTWQKPEERHQAWKNEDLRPDEDPHLFKKGGKGTWHAEMNVAIRNS